MWQEEKESIFTDKQVLEKETDYKKKRLLWFILYLLVYTQ